MKNLIKKLRFYYIKAKEIAGKINNLDSDAFALIDIKAPRTTDNTNIILYNKTIKSQLGAYNKSNLDKFFINDFKTTAEIREMLTEIYDKKNIDFIIRSLKEKYIFLFENLPPKFYKKNDVNLIKQLKQDLINILYT